MVDAAKIRIAVEADSSGVGRGLAAGVTSLDQFGNRAQSTFQKVNAAFASLSTGQKVLAGLGVGLGVAVAGFKAVIGPAIEFESAFAGVRKTVEGTPRQLEGIRTGILEMSKVMPTAATELADIAANAGQLGVRAPDVLEFTETIAQLGETTDLSFDDASQSLARFLNITGDGAGAIEGVADVLVDLGNNSATTESQIVDFSTRLASAFTVAGASSDQILALASSFSSLGLRAEAGGSALSTIITSISDAAKTGGADLRTYADTAGLLPDQFARIAEENPIEALLLFGEGLRSVQDRGESITPILEDIELGGLRTSEVFRLLALNSGFVRDQLRLAADALAEGGAAQAEYDKRVETTAARLDIFRNRLQAVAIAAGTPLLDVFARSVDLAGDAIEELIEILSPLASEIVDTFSAAGKAAGLFASELGGPVIGVASDALIGLTSVLSDLLGLVNSLGPAGLIVVALAVDIAKLGPVSLRARIGLLGLQQALAAGGISGASRAAAAGLSSFIASINPLIIVAGIAAIGLARIGSEMRAMKQAAEEAANTFRVELQSSLDSQNYTGFISTVERINKEISDLDKIADLSLGERLFGTRVLEGGISIEEIFTGIPDQVREARTEIEALEKVLEETGANDYSAGLERVASSLGISTDAAGEVVEELGLVEDVMALGTATTTGYQQAHFGVVSALESHLAGQKRLSEELDLSLEKILAGEAGLEDFTSALGISGEAFYYLISQLEQFDPEDVFDPEQQVAVLDATTALNNEYERLGAQLGLTGEQIELQNASLDRLAESHNRLQQAVQGVLSAMEAMQAQQRITEEATVSFEEALAGVGASEESIVAASNALRVLTANQVANGTSAAQAAINQEAFARSIVDAAVAAGADREEVEALVGALGLILPSYLAELELDAQPAQDDLDETTSDLDDYASTVFTATADADTSSATSRMDQLRRESRAVVDEDYTLSADADTLSATERMDQLRRHGRDVADEEYELQGTAADAGATDTMSDIGSEGRRVADDDYTVNMEATDNATGTINSVEAAARRAAGTYRVNLVTYTSTVALGIVSRVPSYAQSDRWGSMRGFDSGGITGKLERPGRANIYSPATPYRVFAEPQTGGEAYIPIRGDRQRNHEIWTSIGSILGFMRYGGIALHHGEAMPQQGVMARGGVQAAALQNGGITTTTIPTPTVSTAPSVIITSPITVQVSGSSGNAEQIGTEVANQVRSELGRMARQLANTRI